MRARRRILMHTHMNSNRRAGGREKRTYGVDGAAVALRNTRAIHRVSGSSAGVLWALLLVMVEATAAGRSAIVVPVASGHVVGAILGEPQATRVRTVREAFKLHEP